MPELPEVETSRAYVERFCLGSTIEKCLSTEQGGGPRDGLFDDKVIGEDMTAEKLSSTLEGRKIVALKRRGKQMWFVLDKPPHILFHFGMTGAFTVKGESRHKFVKFSVSEGWPPKFTKLELQMSNGTCLALTDPRRLAKVRLRMDPEASHPISSLGPDPVTHPMALDDFAMALAKPTAPIKAVLLDQERVVSGVGNWIADEVCFQAGVHPGARCNTLSPDQVAALHTKLLSICREACGFRADYTSFPKEWLFHHRWGKGKGTGDKIIRQCSKLPADICDERWGKGKSGALGAPCISTGHPILFDVVGGRTTAIVPAVQRMGLLEIDTRAVKKEASAAKKRRSAKDATKQAADDVKEEVDTAKDAAPPGSAGGGGRGRGGSKGARSSGSTKAEKLDNDSAATPASAAATTAGKAARSRKPVLKKGTVAAVAKGEGAKVETAPLREASTGRKISGSRAAKAEASTAAVGVRRKRGTLKDEKTAPAASQSNAKRAKSGAKGVKAAKPVVAHETALVKRGNASRRSPRLAA